jgi:GTP-binding protein HflX
VHELHGNTTGLSPSATRALERLYRRKVPPDDIATPELIRALAAASMETGRQVGVLVHRSGQVDSVIVGDAGSLMLPDVGRLRAAEGRFRALRLVHTHLRGEPLTDDDVVDLVRLRLDLVCAILMSPAGEIRGLHWAHNVPGVPPFRKVGPAPLGQAKVDVLSLMADLEAEFGRRTQGREVRAKDGRAILVHVYEKGERGGAQRAALGLKELQELARTAGVEVACTLSQARERIDPKTVMGHGKLNEIILRAAELDADVLVFDRNLSPAQAAAIAKTSDLKVIDRSQLILDIFAQRAESHDGKLQVELAQLKYAMPRLGLKDDSLSRLTGGIGGRGPGETKLEIGKRRAKDRVSHLEAELRRLAKQRTQRRRKRTRAQVPTVAIVGYTNAGKSTLLNAMTGSEVLAEDKLFATLDTRSRVLRVGWAGYGDREVVVTDTVGFVRDLPKDLFAAFRATFEEAADADLILHVVDASDPDREGHIETTDGVLEELGLLSLPQILVMNKTDLLEQAEIARIRREHKEAVLLSAMDRESTRPLIERIAESLSARWEQAAKAPPSTYDLSALDVEAEGEGEPAAHDGAHAETLDELLAASGRRRKGHGAEGTT